MARPNFAEGPATVRRVSIQKRKLMNDNFSNRSRSAWLYLALSSLILSVSVSSATARTPSAQHQDNETTQGKEEVLNLLAVLRDPELRTTHPEQVVQAVQRLGEMRAVEAIHDLIELLTYSRRFDWERDDMIVEIQPITPGNRYPAASALFQIGRPALPALAKVVELNGLDSVRGQNAMYAIQGIFRNDPNEGVKYFERAAETSDTPDSAQHLMQAAAQLRQLANRLSSSKK
jgi:hypothetical protein